MTNERKKSMFYIINFPEGKRVTLEKLPEQVLTLVQDHFSQEKALPAGDTNLTPKNFLFRHFDYVLRVQRDAASGLLVCLPRFNDVVATHKWGGWLVHTRGVQTYSLPDPTKAFVLSGPNEQRQLAVWLVVYFSQTIVPEQRLREVKQILWEQLTGGNSRKNAT